MLIQLKSKNDKEIVVKDILMIDFDMRVKKSSEGKYLVQVNDKYDGTEEFENKQDAVDTMLYLMNLRNAEEDKLNDY